MPLSDADAQNRIKRMLDVINDEGNDEADKLIAKAEEDFNIEKGRLIQQQQDKIMEHYDKKEKQVELRKKIQISTLHNQSRLRILKAMEDHLKEVLEEARETIAQVTTDKTRYKTVLEGLIAQGLCQLLETGVIIRCCKLDIDIVQEAIPGAIANYQKLSKGREMQVTIDTENFLGPDVSYSGNIVKLLKGVLDNAIVIHQNCWQTSTFKDLEFIQNIEFFLTGLELFRIILDSIHNTIWRSGISSSRKQVFCTKHPGKSALTHQSTDGPRTQSYFVWGQCKQKIL